MARCPNCMNEVPEKNFCEICGTPMRMGAPGAGQPGVYEKHCPYCKKSYPPEANFCKDCVVDGRSVNLLARDESELTKIDLVEVVTNNKVTYTFSGFKQFGRKDFREWYRLYNLITKVEWRHISRNHFRIEEKEGGFILFDTKSSNGVILNDNQMVPEKPYPVESGAEIGIPMGNRNIKFRMIIRPPEKEQKE